MDAKPVLIQILCTFPIKISLTFHRSPSKSVKSVYCRHMQATWSTNRLKVSFLATKSVSQFSSTMAPRFPRMSTPIRPCAVARSATLVAFDQPRVWACSCSHFSACKSEMMAR